MKRKYEPIECSVIRFENEDIVTASSLTSNLVNSDSSTGDTDFTTNFLK